MVCSSSATAWVRCGGVQLAAEYARHKLTGPVQAAGAVGGGGAAGGVFT